MKDGELEKLDLETLIIMTLNIDILFIL